MCLCGVALHHRRRYTRGVRDWRTTLRKLLSLLLMLAMLPSWGELVETAEHMLHDGHLPHSASHEAVASTEKHAAVDTEHGCTPLSHHCACHVSMPVLPGDSPPALRPLQTVTLLRWSPREDTLSSRSDPPPTPPPAA